MNNPVHDELIRLSLKRELSEDDRARIEAALAAHPELREQWEADMALGRALRSLPDVPVSSNFTSRVLDEIDFASRELGRSAARSSWREWLRRVQPRLTWGFALALVVAFGAYEYEAQQSIRAQKQIQQAQLVHEIRDLSQEITALPDPAVFKDFEVINQFSQMSSSSDDELLRVLK